VTSLISVYKALGGGWQIRCPGFHPHRINEFEAEEIVSPTGEKEETLPEIMTDEAN
jgi:hypothetical protein